LTATTPKLAAVVMAAGLGTRMRSETPKHLHPLLGRSMIDWTLDSARSVEPDRLVVVASPATEAIFEGVEVAVQKEPRGTGDAAAAARLLLEGFEGDVLVLSDTPLLTQDVLEGLLEEHRSNGADVTLLSFEPDHPFPYGRVVRDASGEVQAVVEELDASDEQRSIRELNTSIYVFSADALWSALAELDSHNAQGELYLTDTIARIVEGGGKAAAYLSPDPDAPVGINNRAELAWAAGVLQRRINERHMLAGVTIVDPRTTWIEADVELEPDVVVHPFTVLRGRTRAAARAEIGPHAVAVDAEIGTGALVGPFCYLRAGTVLETDAKAGTFVEIKNSRIGKGTKVPHLSYVGDADIGDGTNIAAGNIMANFPHEPGREKQRTTIGRNVKTGVQNAFIAPVTIGDDAWTAAGSVITEDVPPEALAIARARQVTKEGYARSKRDD
jgi:bifunctional UDP-N-acetylglucosamine pyrophosphorylase / glucosamine-1-phosphate N-acetyltransferase